MNTIDFYNKNADFYIADTFNLNLSTIQNKFLSYIPKSGFILDFGCGSGRDTKAFMNKGYKVDAVDGSLEICKKVSRTLNINVKCMDFFDLNDIEKYDGIFACASLLHIKYSELPKVLHKAYVALKNNGVIYMSFKYGSEEMIVDDKLYTNINEVRINEIISKTKFNIEEIWYTDDNLPNRTVKWINVICRKGE